MKVVVETAANRGNGDRPGMAAFPNASLRIDGTTIYGTTGGQSGNGIGGSVFRLNLDGSEFLVLQDFASGGPGSLLPHDSTLFGLTGGGGRFGQGTLFAIAASEPSTAALSVIASLGVLLVAIRSRQAPGSGPRPRCN